MCARGFLRGDNTMNAKWVLRGGKAFEHRRKIRTTATTPANRNDRRARTSTLTGAVSRKIQEPRRQGVLDLMCEGSQQSRQETGLYEQASYADRGPMMALWANARVTPGSKGGPAPRKWGDAGDKATKEGRLLSKHLPAGMGGILGRPSTLVQARLYNPPECVPKTSTHWGNIGQLSRAELLTTSAPKTGGAHMCDVQNETPLARQRQWQTAGQYQRERVPR